MSTKGKIASGIASATAILAPASTAFCADPTVNEAVQAAETLMGKLTAVLNITNIVAILGAGITACAGLFLAWWGARKLVRMLMGVFKKGKLSI